MPPEDPPALAQGLIDLALAPASERRRLGADGAAYVREHHDLAKVAARMADELRTTVELGRA